MNIIFFGTPYYVLPVLDKIHRAFRTQSGTSPIQAVVTQRPKPTGREQKLKYSAVDDWAHKKKVPIHFNPLEIVNLYPIAEIGILASYGQIIPQSVIDHFQYGILNVHPSLLPYWRGASPVQASIIDGGPVGSTIMKLDEKLDHGPIVDQFEDELREDDNTKTLRDRLFERSGEVMTGLIPAYINNKINLEEQVHEKATYTTQIQKDDAYIDHDALSTVLSDESIDREWDVQFMKDFTTGYTPLNIHNFIRAMQPWPQAWTTVKLDPSAKDTKRLKLLKSHLEETEDSKQKTENRLILDEVQLEGKTPVSWEQFKDGHPNAVFSS